MFASKMCAQTCQPTTTAAGKIHIAYKPRDIRDYLRLCVYVCVIRTVE